MVLEQEQHIKRYNYHGIIAPGSRPADAGYRYELNTSQGFCGTSARQEWPESGGTQR